MNSPLFDSAGNTYQQTRIAQWDKVARMRDAWRGWGGSYHKRLKEIYRFLVSPGQRVLEIGCGLGELLAATEPGRGLGIDFSSEMIQRATARHSSPDTRLEFVHADAHDLSFIHETFDVIILSDLVNDAWDVQRVLEQLRPLCTPRTRLIINVYSNLWQTILNAAQSLRLAAPMLEQNWLTTSDLRGMLNLAGFESIRDWREILFPLPIPLLAAFCNRFLVRLPFLRTFALANFIIARPAPLFLSPHFQRKWGETEGGEPIVSVIVPARNESGNIQAIFERTPKMGRATELVFVEGHSKDDTYAAIEREAAAHPATPSLLLRQPGIGKADAVRVGFDAATGDVLMILDADLTVPPEDLPRFYEALRSGRGEFINGVRLVYPMEKQAMRGLNFLGNKFFSWAFTSLLGQPIKDTLCGTKVLWKKDYDRIAAGRAYFGDFDPFGDFDLIFGAAKLNLKIVDLPIRYRERTYGSTNISRWKHGLLLMRMVWYAARRIKFV
jgi:SAM-dependent methyltransferase